MAGVSAIEVESFEGDPSQVTITAIDKSELTDNQIQLIQRVASLENKIDNTATKADVVALGEFLAVEIINQFQNKTDFLILAGSLILLAVVVLLVGFFFILKATRRI